MYQILNHTLKKIKSMESLMHLFEYLMTDTYKVFQNYFTFSLSYFFLCIITPYHAPSQNPCILQC